MEEVKMNWLSDQNGNLLAPKTLIEAIQNAEGASLEELLKSSITFADTPIGTVISYMGNTAPKDYLICDGTEYEIAKYKDLAEHIKKEFGSYNYFGGDGTTTFAVPDLRGEFLRGSGENSHENSGNGANVGEHQNATKHIYEEENHNNDWCWYKGATSVEPENYDSTYLQSNTIGQYIDGSIWANSVEGVTFYSARPTNTSVLYCIKYKTDKKSANIIPQHEYSTEEKIVGTWIDGKNVYEKTFSITITNNVDNFVSDNFGDKVLRHFQIDFNGINNNLTSSNNYSDTLFINTSNQLMYYISRTGSWWNGLNTANITIQYTKTTD